MTKTYFEKLKDPRWQRKRLEALTAGQWKCASCSATESTLHVHHRQYFKGREPWEYEVGQLEVLCEDCHTARHEDATPDPLLLAASFVSETGTSNRDAAASLLAGFCGQDINASYVGDPGTFIVGSLSRELDRKASVSQLDELLGVLRSRDRWTISAAMAVFIEDLRVRPAAPVPANRDL